jgi:hypothetical protein
MTYLNIKKKVQTTRGEHAHEGWLKRFAELFNGTQNNGHSRIRAVCLIICLISVGAVWIDGMNSDGATITDVTVSSDDSDIYIKWNQSKLSPGDKAVITIYNAGNIVEEKEVNAFWKGYHFETGEHGTLYTINVAYENRLGEMDNIYETDALFLDYAELPDLPIIEINTCDGEDPT